MEIRWMKYNNENGEKENFYPVTHVRAIVYGEDDNAILESIETEIVEHEDRISNLESILEDSVATLSQI